MERFNFGNDSISALDAMSLLKCSKRTIQNYYHPTKRDPVKWHYLELFATHRILPTGFIWNKNALRTDTGYHYPAAELSQWSFFQSMKNGQIAQLEQKIADLKQENHELRSTISDLKNTTTASTRTIQNNNVINFRPRKALTNGDLTA